MTYIKGVDKIKNFFLDLFFPCFCLGCQKEGSYLCEDCKATLDISEFNYCLCNKNPLLLPPLQKNACLRRQGKCQKCQSKNLSGLYFALPYKEKSLTRKLIHQFKYEPYTKELAKILAKLLIEHFIITNKNTEDIFENSVLIPVPLDNKKLKNRGYNQSEELAKELAKIIKIPVVSNYLIKTKTTKSQMELSGKEREKNLQGAFMVKNPDNLKRAISDLALRGFPQKIFLVDDVYTTGSTMEECARTLKQAGAKQVWGITVAREE
ncbi:MAG: ComF family protein [Patescibacteria group bacterium]